MISGHVLDDLSEPIAGVTVWVLKTRYLQGRRQLVATGANATTDITGRYRLLSLPPGDYAVMGTTRETWPHEAIPRRSSAMRPLIFLGRPRRPRRSASSWASPRKRSGIDFSLVAGRTSTFVAHATSASGLPLGGETVTMTHEIGGPTCGWGQRWPWPRRRLPETAAGRSQIFRPASTASRYGRRRAATTRRRKGQLTVNVAGADVEGLSLVAGAGADCPRRGGDRRWVTASGRIRPHAGAPAVQSERPDDDCSVLHPDNGRRPERRIVRSQGVLSETVLSIGPLTGEWTLKAIEVEGRDIADLPLPIEHGNTLSGVRVGAHQPADDRPRHAARREANPAEGTVIVFADDSAKWREGSRTIRTTRPDQRGLFTFKGLPAGDNFLVALDSVQEAQWYDPEFLEALKSRARRVTIADAESKHVDLELRK